ncbi:MAG: hypothetical protein NZ455_10185 [Bacteroidia bacterium]|nr:hypothetical protein [Bacteroidia bacterium]
MREACGGRASARCGAPRPLFHSCQGGGRVGAQHRCAAPGRPPPPPAPAAGGPPPPPPRAAPLARSTPTRAQRGTRPIKSSS